MENAAGWLVLRVEGKEPQSFALKEGKNLIGRKTSTTNPDIAISDDIFVSRNHAVVVVKKTNSNSYEYILADNTAELGKPSLNGTYINGQKERVGEQPIKLNDGDTIQIGLTKFVLKAADVAVDAQDAVKLAAKIDYKETVSFPNLNVVLRKKI